MSEHNSSSKQSWWHTLPGVLTAIAGLITAVTGLFVGLQQAGFFSDKQDIPHPTDMSSPVTGPDTTLSSEPKADAHSGSGEPTGETSSSRSRNLPQQSTPQKQGIGTLKTSSGSIAFDRIKGMSMGHSKLTISQLGTRVDIPLEQIKKITFQDKNAIRIDYWSGESEETQFHCYWNLPVTFYAGDKEIYYGDCKDFHVVEQIEFHHAQ
ncbi:hypothetical protein [Methylohalobius crimeensis]|uniref:hypothetical protein n=1 Tax=Methylohalobius crimeensis TaxID=244365 RepID=UPI0003B435C6|nr:hypothetical protein [Methylohalobius crimeensis]